MNFSNKRITLKQEIENWVIRGYRVLKSDHIRICDPIWIPGNVFKINASFANLELKCIKAKYMNLLKTFGHLVKSNFDALFLTIQTYFKLFLDN